ncbi:hypothetical protein CEP68_10635 [Brevundimonas vesicularis]|uniref:Uncharacterized protein n=2 Tax=Brevundimonas vesicularis TaxID=41276 RepID=A0A1Z3U9F5_BREVE|nr:hypothetical protein CEP68_10635 [Brevundimonas vesicularis]
MAVQSAEGEWSDVPPGSDDFAKNLPSLIVGYTSGDNETLSLPFFVSRSGYATDVAQAATFKGGRSKTPGVVADNRLLLIDYSTHLEVLVANLLLAAQESCLGR